MDEVKAAFSGVGVLDLLLVLFIGLKLAEVITWSWWWVMSPLWIPFGLVIAGVLIWLAVKLVVRFVVLPAAKKRQAAKASA